MLTGYGGCVMQNYLKKAREPISSYTHFIGAIIFAVGWLLLIGKIFSEQLAAFDKIFCVCCFGLSMVLLYSAIAWYHFVKGSASKIFRLRKLDHSMIYVLIAGTYTPIITAYLPTVKSAPFLLFVWGCAVAGIILKLCWFNAPRFLSTAAYILLGWSILLDTSIFALMPAGALLLLALGGISYTIGGVIYGLKRPDLSEKWGFHELFHLFILGGSLLHYLLVFIYIA